jgi:hypothetical protein
LIVVSASAMCSTPICESCLATASRRVTSRIFLVAGVNGMCPLGRGPGAQYRPVASGGRGPGAGTVVMARRVRRLRRHSRTSRGGRGPGRRLRGSRCAAWAARASACGPNEASILARTASRSIPIVASASESRPPNRPAPAPSPTRRTISSSTRSGMTPCARRTALAGWPVLTAASRMCSPPT